MACTHMQYTADFSSVAWLLVVVHVDGGGTSCLTQLEEAKKKKRGESPNVAAEPRVIHPQRETLPITKQYP